MDDDRAGQAPAVDGFNCPLTPNSNVVSSPLDSDGAVSEFMYRNQMPPYWKPLVSSANPSVVLVEDRGNGVVTFKKGLKVDCIFEGGGWYRLTLTGDIWDSEIRYPYKGQVIARFPSRQVRLDGDDKSGVKGGEMG